jgi:replicative DNA helicase
MGVLSEIPIYIEDTPGLSINEVRSKARRLHAEAGVDLIMIDYLQLMSGRRSDNRVQEVSEISRGLKALARELNVPVIALSQLSRAVEGRQSHVPMLSDLRESGSIEQDADIVMFIYREELYDKETEKKGIAEIHLAKHRNGPLGIVPLRFEARTTRFQNLERYRAPEGY